MPTKLGIFCDEMYTINYMKKQKTLVMTGGGTGGHIMPNLALIPALKKHFEIYYLGQANSLEEKLVKQIEGVTFKSISAVKLERKLTLKNLLIPFKLRKAIKGAKKILKEISPDVVFSKGGFVSLPVAMASHKLHIPVLSHESDLTMGLANKIIHRYAEIVFTSFRETCISNKCIFSGSPVRSDIFKGDAEIAKKYCRFSSNKPVLMFFGGSKGSQTINKFVFDNLDNLNDFNIIHFVGSQNAKTTHRTNYAQIEFAENIYDFYALSDIVICRAGANSIFELLALRKLMLLIPLSLKVSRGDQIDNAKNFKASGYAEVLQEEDLNIENLLSKIQNLQKNKFYYISNMQKVQKNSANQMICNYILEYANKKTQNN